MSKLDSLNRETDVRLTVARLTRLTLLVTGVGILLYACVLLPLYTQLAANVMYQEAWWVAAIGLCADVVNLLVLLIVCPITVYALWVGGWKGACRLPILYMILTVVKQAVNYVANIIADGRAPTAKDVGDDLAIILPMLGLELLEYALIVVLTVVHRSRRMRRQAREAGISALGGEPAADVAVLPLVSFWNQQNPVQRSLFDAGLVLLLFRFMNHLVYQMTLIVWYGTTDSPIQLVIDAVGDVLIGVIAYLLGILIVNRLYAKGNK